MPFAIARDGTRIHYREAGDADRGPAVVLIQGLSLSGRFWFDLPERIARSGARVVWLDNRGTGQSDRARRPFSMRTLAGDVAAVMESAGVACASVVGISMGGMIAQQVAMHHPDRVEGLVLLATTPGLPHGHLPPLPVLTELARLPFLRGRAASRAFAKLLLSPKAMPRAAELLARWPEAFAADPRHPSTFFLQLFAISMHSSGAHLPKIKVPTVVITGRDDVLVDPRNSSILARLLPECELELLDDVGHSIPSHDPEVVERALAKIWARTRAGTGVTRLEGDRA